MIMKRYIIIFLLSVLSLSGCDKFLTSTSYDKREHKNYFRNDEEVNTGVLACYNGIHGPLAYEYYVTEIRSDNSRSYREAPVSDTELELSNLDVFRVETSNSFNNNYWEKTYHNIANCNTVLQFLDNVSDPDKRIQYEGEARFIRAYHYFNLVRLYGPVFKVTERISAEVAKQYERSAVNDIYELVEEDLEFAAGNLPEGYPEDQIGRVDRWAAKTLLAKVYLTRANAGAEMDRELLVKARTLLEEVEKDSRYDLVKDAGTEDCPYANVFSIRNEMNKELLFVSRYLSGGKGLGSPFANYFAPQGSLNVVIYGSGSGLNCPTEDLMETYGLEPEDQRMSFILEKDWSKEDGTKMYVAWVKKYYSEVITRYDAENDWPIIRYADVLLMLGEIENELNGPTDKAISYLNSTRSRAGITTELRPTNKISYRDAMLNERRLEFAFENQRFFDLQRSGRLTELMKAHFDKETYRNNSNGNVTAEYYNNPRAQNVLLSEADRTLKPYQYLLPIPYNVMISAPNATQNNGY